MLVKLLVLILLFLQLCCGAKYICPAKEVTFPCDCDDINGTITCRDIKEIEFDLVKKFQQIEIALDGKSKHFNKLVVSETGVKELPENALGNLTFLNLEFWVNRELRYINPNAFGKNANVTNILTLSYSKLSLTNIMDVASNFRNLSSLAFRGNAVNEFPANVFAKPNLRTLRSLELADINHIELIGDYAFSSLNNLDSLGLLFSKINKISKHGLTFVEASNQSLYINMDDCNLTENTFTDDNALANFNRPVTLKLGQELYNYCNANLRLVERLFRPFLRDPRNSLSMGGCRMKCDCTVAWLFAFKDRVQKRVTETKCEDGHSLWEQIPSKFKDCPLTNRLLL